VSAGSNQGSPINVQCPKCAAKLRATAELVGKRIACPKCGSRVLIPHIGNPTGDQHANNQVGNNQSGIPDGVRSQDEDWFSLEPSSDAPTKFSDTPPILRDTPPSTSEAESLAEDPLDEDSAGSSAVPQRSVFDDDLPDLTPFEEPLSSLSDPKNRREDDLLRSYLGPSEDPFHGTSTDRGGEKKNAGSRGINGLEKALAQTQKGVAKGQRGAAEGQNEVAEEQDGEYSVVCKVCGTLLYVRPSSVGKQIRCPDCHSEFPQPAPKPKKKPTETRWDERDTSVQLAPAEGANPRIVSRETVNTKSILDKAAEELKREAEELDGVSGVFDTEDWLAMVFGFLSDRSLVVAVAILSIFAAIFGYVFHSLGPYVLDQEYWHLQLARLLMFVLGFIPIVCAVMLCCLAIIPKAANRLTKVEEWPFGKLGDSMGELMMLFIAIAGTYAIGLPIGSALYKMRAPYLIYGSIPTLSLWGLLPIVLLSMIESGSLFPPLTRSILKSLSQKPDAWGAMYMQTGVVLAIFFVMTQVAFLYGPIAVGILFFLFPWVFCFIANQYGTLAGRISDVTELGFEGEFTEEEE